MGRFCFYSHKVLVRPRSCRSYLYFVFLATKYRWDQGLVAVLPTAAPLCTMHFFRLCLCQHKYPRHLIKIEISLEEFISAFSSTFNRFWKFFLYFYKFSLLFDWKVDTINIKSIRKESLQIIYIIALNQVSLLISISWQWHLHLL